MKKRKLGILLLLVLIIILSACGSKEEGERVFEIEEAGGIITTISYEHIGDDVHKQTIKYTYPYEALGITQEEAEMVFAPEIEDLQGIDGLHAEIIYEETEFREKYIIDFEKIDIDKVDQISVLSISETGDLERGISMEKSAEMVLEDGFEEIE